MAAASLFRGAVAMPSTIPARASSPALVTHSMAALPQGTLSWPTEMSSGFRLWMSTTSTVDGSSPAPIGSSVSRMVRGRPVALTAWFMA